MRSLNRTSTDGIPASLEAVSRRQLPPPWNSLRPKPSGKPALTTSRSANLSFLPQFQYLKAPRKGCFFMHPPFHYAGSLECRRISDTLFGLQNPRMAPPKNVAVEAFKMAGRVFVPLAYAKPATGQANRQIRHASVLPRLRNYRIGQTIVSLKISFAVPRLSPLRVTA